MDLQAAENAHKKEKKEEVKTWNCPCSGCAKAVKQERKRILDELNKIELNDQHQTNAVGLKMLVEKILNPEVKK